MSTSKSGGLKISDIARRILGKFRVSGDRAEMGFSAQASVGRACSAGGGVRLKGVWEVECRRCDGSLKWREQFANLVVNEGLNHILDSTLAGQTQITTWYVGLLAASPSPQPSWTKTEVGANDFVNYDETELQTWTPNGAASGQSVSNSNSKAVFTISANGSTIGGAFLASTNTKAVETGAAKIYAAGAFTGGNKSADDDDTLSVTATFTSADDGV